MTVNQKLKKLLGDTLEKLGQWQSEWAQTYFFHSHPICLCVLAGETHVVSGSGSDAGGGNLSHRALIMASISGFNRWTMERTLPRASAMSRASSGVVVLKYQAASYSKSSKISPVSSKYWMIFSSARNLRTCSKNCPRISLRLASAAAKGSEVGSDCSIDWTNERACPVESLVRVRNRTQNAMNPNKSTSHKHATDIKVWSLPLTNMSLTSKFEVYLSQTCHWYQTGSESAPMKLWICTDARWAAIFFQTN